MSFAFIARNLFSGDFALVVELGFFRWHFCRGIPLL